ncbi:MAG TPA: tRNA 5-methoxyuridine(34)/uridine 5-oxyacetic acid(34) synthase CmoB [Gammaproteobacteria bacterium]|nr:tRNA 5-methoxyuridine(34)/uridine 5-oxyacetic acid(34) synthase CmoB [Gammaproteobacteria bacterium]
MRFYAGLEKIRGNAEFERWRDSLPRQLAQALRPEAHGRIGEWFALLERLPRLTTAQTVYERAIRVRADKALSSAALEELRQLLLGFKPWRKGPFDIHGVCIDSEWRSDLKWDRLCQHIAPLRDRLVLDVGCGNGYHLWRMHGVGARAAIGLDPTLAYVVQYCAVRHFIPEPAVYVLPLALEDLAEDLRCFDTVFSMGVLYHCRDPLQHLRRLKRCLRPGGELVLETLVVEGADGTVLEPEERYARMKNVHFIPSCAALEQWLREEGFVNIRLLDVTATTAEEQRATPWSTEVSLRDFLDPNDSSKTIEGYPAPARAIMLANVG